MNDNDMMDEVEGWWARLRPQVTSSEMSTKQIAAIRSIFFIGVWHMHELVAVLSSDQSPGALERMQQKLEDIAEELKHFEMENNRSGGHA